MYIGMYVFTFGLNYCDDGGSTVDAVFAGLVEERVLVLSAVKAGTSFCIGVCFLDDFLPRFPTADPAAAAEPDARRVRRAGP